MTFTELRVLRGGSELQFGHSVAAVDDASRPTTQDEVAALQFGHSVAAVDDLRHP